MSIILEHVTVSYGRGAKRFDAARNVNLSVAEGEAYGLVGESGSGKSTVLRAVGSIPRKKERKPSCSRLPAASRSCSIMLPVPKP